MGFLRLVLEIILFILVIRVIIDLFPGLKEKGWGKTLIRTTNPILAPLQRYLTPISIGDAKVDASGLVVVLLLNLLLNLIF